MFKSYFVDKNNSANIVIKKLKMYLKIFLIGLLRPNNEGKRPKESQKEPIISSLKNKSLQSETSRSQSLIKCQEYVFF